MQTNQKTQRLMVTTMLLGASIILNLFEPAVPIPIPGVRFGLANSIGLLTLYLFDFKTMFTLQLLRVILSTMLRGIFLGIGFWMSLAGALSSCLILALLFKFKQFSPIGLSLASAYAHNIGQMVAMVIIMKTISIIYWLPFMLIAAIVTGYLTGWIVKMVLTALNKSRKKIYEA